jgi:ribonuclease BN (tRNA processing enzyme)
MEVGSGAFAALQSHLRLDELDAVWFSHMHPDHAGDLPAIANWLLNRADQRRALKIFGPPKWFAHLSAFLPTSVESLRSVVDAYEIQDRQLISIGDLQLENRAVRHSIETYGVRIQSGTRVIAYSGDTAPCIELDELADGADVFLCESGMDQREHGRVAAHCTPEDAAETARRASVKRLVLTHLAPALDPVDAQSRAVSIHTQTDVAVSNASYEI